MAFGSFGPLFSPRRTVIFGSVRENKIAHQIFTQMTRGGYEGELFSVNPSAMNPEGIDGIPAFASVADIPGEVDLAVLAVPARFAADTLTACGEKGIPFAVLLTSGFSEIGEKDREEEIKQIASLYGIRLVGPNCAGVMSTPSKLFASIEERALPGKTALISQSGAVGAACLAMAGERRIGFSHFVSFGNRADIDESELLDFFLEDEATGLVAMYLESVKDGRRFLESAARFAARKPLILIKAGRSQAGMRAASSHTGSMAGSDAVFDAACRQTGVLRVSGIEEMLDLCVGFEHYPVPRGKKLLIVTNSGGPGILTSDAAEAAGLDLALPPEELRRELKESLLPNASLGNPIDLTVEGTEEDYSKSISLCLKDAFDSAIAINVGTPFLSSLGLAEGIAEGAEEVPGKPVVPVFMSGRIVADGADYLTDSGLPPLPTGERAANVLSAMADWNRTKGAKPKSWALASPSEKTAVGSDPGIKPDKMLEPEQVRFLEENGIEIRKSAFITSEEEIHSRRDLPSYPVVMKVVSPKILHKSEYGGVKLNLNSAEETAAAFRDMRDRLAEFDFKGVMLYEQVPMGEEIILGARKDPDFGPVILLGAGGIMSEVLKDITLRIAPLEREECRAMLKDLKFNRIIEGFRGAPPLARESLVDLAVKLSELVIKHEWIEEIEFNPVFLYEDRAVIGDVRIL